MGDCRRPEDHVFDLTRATKVRLIVLPVQLRKNMESYYGVFFF